MWCTSTSYIDFSSVSGSMPWDIVRLPCGSMSHAQDAMPFLGEGHGEVERGRGLGDAALLVGERDHVAHGEAPICEGRHPRAYSHAAAESSASLHRPPRRASHAIFECRARTARQAPAVRHRQGRRRQVDRGDRARAARRPARSAHDRRRAGQPGAGAGPVRDDDAASSSASSSSRRGLFTISIDPQQAMEEYLRVKAGPLGQALGSSRLFQAFAMATPGMRELLSIGKVWELAQLDRRTRGAAPYDLVIVDAPATGHGVGLLRTPRTFADIARVGPIAHQGQHDRRHDRRSRVHRRDRGRHARGDAGQRDDDAGR